MRSAVLTISLLISLPLLAQIPLPQLGKAPVKDVVKAMTLEEKVLLVVGTGMNVPAGGPAVGATRSGVPGAAGTTHAIPRLGIPSIVLADGPAGLRITPIRDSSGKTYYCTAFPVASALASSWDTLLIQNIGKAFGNEVHEYGVDILLAPALNIQRHPLGGRNFEYYSEDPLIAGRMTAAIVQSIQYNGVGTSIKHFAANNQETNRSTVNTIVSERALREIYLRGFEIALQHSAPWTVMSSYNKINGVYSSERYDLLTTILRKEWGYGGFVMSDWFGGRDAVAQMKAGNDLLMPGTDAQTKSLTEAVQHNSLSVTVLDENVSRMLSVILQSPSFKKYAYSEKPDLKAHALVARIAAAESMVLLKNDKSALPFAAGIKTIALFGNTSYNMIAGGTGSGDVNKAYSVSLAEGLARAGFTVNSTLQNSYLSFAKEQKAMLPKPAHWYDPVQLIPEMPVDDKLMQNVAASDVAVITIGRSSGEFFDRKPADFYLSAAEQKLITNVVAAFHGQQKKVIIVLNTGGVIETASWRSMADGILLAWQPGQEGGNAVTDLLSGKTVPSGKLAVTFPMDYTDASSDKNFPGREFPDSAASGNSIIQGKPSEVRYEEDVFVGYRYYDIAKVEPAYEFGYGLSYTGFSYGNLMLSSSTFNGKITASVEITNSGEKAGKEIVQLYLTAPSAKMKKPEKELKGFAKTALLQPGQKQVVRFEVWPSDLASYDAKQSSWIAEAGKYIIGIGSSSRRILQTAFFALDKELTVKRTTKSLVPQ